jgi:hypothetical protein
MGVGISLYRMTALGDSVAYALRALKTLVVVTLKGVEELRQHK